MRFISDACGRIQKNVFYVNTYKFRGFKNCTTPMLWWCCIKENKMDKHNVYTNICVLWSGNNAVKLQ